MTITTICIWSNLRGTFVDLGLKGQGQSFGLNFVGVKGGGGDLRFSRGHAHLLYQTTIIGSIINFFINRASEWDWLLNVTCNDISVIYVRAHRRAGGLKKSEWVSEWDWLLNVTCNNISVIYVTAHRCAGGLKKKLHLRGRAPRGDIQCKIPVYLKYWDHHTAMFEYSVMFLSDLCKLWTIR